MSTNVEVQESAIILRDQGNIPRVEIREHMEKSVLMIVEGHSIELGESDISELKYALVNFLNTGYFDVEA
jgi:hypothetical protein